MKDIFLTPDNDKAISAALNMFPLGITEKLLIDNHEPKPGGVGCQGGRLGVYDSARGAKIQATLKARGSCRTTKGYKHSEATKNKIRLKALSYKREKNAKGQFVA